MMPMLKCRTFFIAVALVFSGMDLAVAQNEDPLSARQVVETFQAKLIEVMKQGKKLGYQGRYEKLDPAVRASHDLKRIARITVGREWSKLSEQQKEQWIDVFSRLSISSYAHNFKGFSGESFRFESEEETPNKRGVIVRSFFVIPDEKKEVKFDYLMKKSGDSWLIINIIANGVSDLALKRSEYSSIMDREGYNALISKITEKIEKYSQQSE